MRFYQSTRDRIHKVFISYHHCNDQWYKNKLVEFGNDNDIFIDRSVDTGGIPDDLPDQTIRQKIRDEYLRDSTVTILLVGTETKRRKHVDWEIYSSMFNGRINKKSGILVVNLPSSDPGFFWAAHGNDERAVVYPEYQHWQQWSRRVEFEEKFPYMPSRILDNLVHGAAISVVNWDRILDVRRLKFLLDAAFAGRSNCDYDLRTPMRRHNS